MERSAQRNPSRGFNLFALASCLLIVLPARLPGQDVVLSARLDDAVVPPGSITTLRVFAEIPPGTSASVRQIARWRIDLLNGTPRVAGGRYPEIAKPGSDGSDAASSGTEVGSSLLGIADSFLGQPGAGRRGPVELLRVPITAHATGMANLIAAAAPNPDSFTLLREDGTEVQASLDPALSPATFEVRASEWTAVPCIVRTVPTRRLEAREFEVRFSPAAGADHVVESSLQPSGPWTALPGAPHNSGRVLHRSAAEGLFYRVRCSAVNWPNSGVAIDYFPVWAPGIPNTEISFDPLSGWAHQLEFRDSPAAPWERSPGGPYGAAPIVIPGAWENRSFQITARPPVDRSMLDVFLIAGQSNGLLLDYDHEVAVSNAWRFDGHGGFVPLTRPAGVPALPFAYSFPIAAAEGLASTGSRPVLVVPCSVGSTTIGQWMPAGERFGTATCFGNANRRRLLAAPHGLKALWYSGHEGDMLEPLLLERYEDHWSALIRAFRSEFGPVPVIYAQVAKLTDAGLESSLHAGAEKQRLAESGQQRGLEHHHMVVTFDLPLRDHIHLSPAAHQILGRRFALATREHVRGEVINGTGPRLVGVTFGAADRGMIVVRFDRHINEAVEGYDHQFRVFSGTREVALQRVERGEGGDSVVLRFGGPQEDPVTVSYGDRPAAGTDIQLMHVVKDDDGLPAPQFGPLTVR